MYSQECVIIIVYYAWVRVYKNWEFVNEKF